MLPITYETAASRALRLRCPRCGEGDLFRNWFSMHPQCSHCQLRFERAPGYFLGSAYVNYGIISLTLTAMYMGLHFGAEISNRVLVGPLVAYFVLVPLFLFRYARSWWLAMDCYFDPTSFSESEDYMVRGAELNSSPDELASPGEVPPPTERGT
ncbi:MAG: DUF983 domain-containing protein [Planctomycetes bacterium]|nr:DUF983 domain-containing protein [Planctomycetota bacterium]